MPARVAPDLPSRPPGATNGLVTPRPVPIRRHRGTGPAGRALLAAASAAPAALVTAGVDTALAGGGRQALSIVLGLHLALAIVIVGVESLLGFMLGRGFSLRSAASSAWALFQGPSGPARLYALSTLAVGVFITAQILVAWFQGSFHHRGLMALSLALLLLGVVLVAGLLYLPLVSAWELLLRVTGKPSLLVALLVLSASLGGLTAWSLRGGLLGEGWDLRPALLLAMFLLVQLTIVGALGAGNRRLSALVLVVGVALAAVFLPRAALDLSHRPALSSQVSNRSALASRLLATLHRALDRDGDGFAAALGGGDCDDADPSRNPSALDVQGNGLDEDCDGVDNPGLR